METGNEDGRTLGGKEGSEGEVSGVCRGHHWQRMTLSRDPLRRELARCSRRGEWGARFSGESYISMAFNIAG
jgi:hypothetical protein